MRRRMEIYLKAKEYMKENIKKYGQFSAGLCSAINEQILKDEPFPFENMDCYPEIYRHRPTKEDHLYWFPRNKKGTAKRLKILTKAIKEIQGKLNSKVD